jgi:hypothetical protein
VTAASEEESTGTVASRADLVALLQAAVAAAQFREIVAALKSQVQSNEIATHCLNDTLSGKDKEIGRLEALRGEGEEGVGGRRRWEVDSARRRPPKWRKLREKEASEARLMAASRDRSSENSQAQSQIDQLIEMVSTLAARQQPCSLHIA